MGCLLDLPLWQMPYYYAIACNERSRDETGHILDQIKHIILIIIFVELLLFGPTKMVLKFRPMVFSHYYANTTPILLVQRPILFHSVSLECIDCVYMVPILYSDQSPRY